MQINFNNLSEVALHKFKSQTDLLREISALIETFNHQREQIAESYLSEKQISAYLFYFFSTNYPKLAACLDRLPRELCEQLGESTLIDFGTGPGTLLFAWSDYFNNGRKCFGIDSSSSMLNQARKIAKTFYANRAIQWSEKLPIIDSDKRTLMFSHSLNEITENKRNEIIEKVRANYIVVLEPGTKETFGKILGLRNYLLERDYSVEYPCSLNAKCPIEDKDDWCHQYLKLTHDISIESLTQKLKKDRRNVPLIFHVYSKREAEKEPRQGSYLFRTLKPTKFSFELMMCSENNRLIKLQILKKNLSKQQAKQVNSLKAGEFLAFELEKELAADYLRVNPFLESRE